MSSHKDLSVSYWAGVGLPLAPGEVGVLPGLDGADGEPSKSEETRGDTSWRGDRLDPEKAELGSATVPRVEAPALKGPGHLARGWGSTAGAGQQPCLDGTSGHRAFSLLRPLPSL